MKRELDSRVTGEGEHITLWWDDALDRVQVVVSGKDGAVRHEIEVPSGNAGDAFRHPYLYLAEPAPA
jgi:hypothetical protein